jgi:hypothetical protein
MDYLDNYMESVLLITTIVNTQVIHVQKYINNTNELRVTRIMISHISAPSNEEVQVEDELKCSPEALIRRICVGYPYNKLTNLRIVDSKTIECAFTPEQEQDLQGDRGHGIRRVKTSEMVRHMAIAGSFACALQQPNDKQSYYLIIGGTFTPTGVALDRAYDTTRICVQATCKEFEGNTATASVESNGCVLYISYVLEHTSTQDEYVLTSRSSALYNPLLNRHYVRVPDVWDVKSSDGITSTTSLHGIGFPGHFNTSKGECYAF